MNEATKQRLVGALVLGSLAIIFIPILLDGDGLNSPELPRSIPAAPPRPAVPDIHPERPAILSDTLSSSSAESAPAPETAPVPPVAEAAPASPPEPERPALDERGLPMAWHVRLASFAESANAESLVARLQRNGYKGYSRPIDSSQGPLTAVYVGPVLTRAEAEALQKTLQREFSLEGLVVRFEIAEPEH